MIRTIEGTYQNGQIELTELPEGVNDRAQVLVTFLDSSKIDSAKLRQLIDQLDAIDEVEPTSSLTKQPRPFGLCAGEFVVPDDFDASLPEDILSAFEGE